MKKLTKDPTGAGEGCGCFDFMKKKQQGNTIAVAMSNQGYANDPVVGEGEGGRVRGGSDLHAGRADSA